MTPHAVFTDKPDSRNVIRLDRGKLPGKAADPLTRHQRSKSGDRFNRSKHEKNQIKQMAPDIVQHSAAGEIQNLAEADRRVGMKPVPAVELNAQIMRFSDITGQEPALQFPDPVKIAIGKRHLMNLVTFFCGMAHFARFGHVHAERLFAEYVLARGGCCQRLRRV